VTRNQIEYVLDHGLLYVRMKSGNLWQMRRNGRTQTWKTRPKDYRIPVKAGLRLYSELTRDTVVKKNGERYEV